MWGGGHLESPVCCADGMVPPPSAAPSPTRKHSHCLPSLLGGEAAGGDPGSRISVVLLRMKDPDQRGGAGSKPRLPCPPPAAPPPLHGEAPQSRGPMLLLLLLLDHYVNVSLFQERKKITLFTCPTSQLLFQSYTPLPPPKKGPAALLRGSLVLV